MDEHNQSTLAELEKTATIPYLEIGAGFLIGLSIGYVLKKSFKALLFLLGLGLIFLFVLEGQGVITLNENNLQQSIDTGANLFVNFIEFLKVRLERFKISGGVSAIVGFYIGMKLG